MTNKQRNLLTSVLFLIFGVFMFIQCACHFTDSVAHSADGIGESKRKEIKELIRSLKEGNPDIEQSIFNALHAVCIETFPAWKEKGQQHSFLENY